MVAPARDAMKTPPPSNAPPPQQTPITHKAVTQTFSMDATNEMKEVYQSIAFDTKGHYLVGLEPDRFLEKFMPWNPSTSDAYKNKVPSKLRLKNLERVPPKPRQKESVMYRPFVDALDKWITKGALKSAKVPKPQTLRFLNTNLPDTSCNNLNPDISIYLEDDFPDRTNFSLQQTHAEFKPDIGHDPFQHVSDEGPNNSQEEETTEDGDELQGVDSDEDEEEDVFPDEDSEDEGEDSEDEGENDEQDEDEDQADVNVELNHDDTDNGLLLEEIKETPRNEVYQEEEYIASDEGVNMARPLTSLNVEADTESGNHTRGQIAAYAGLALSMTFRKHFFSMLILGRYARFIRWDRRGAVVTHRFDYIKHPKLIFNFYLCYGQLTPFQRGFDSMVERCTGVLPKSVRAAFERYHESAWYGGAKFKRGEGPLSFEGFLRIKVTDNVEQNRTEAFFIPPPRYQRSSLFPFCRATRRSLACPSVGKPAMCFLKDSWHEESLRSGCEADIYRTLKKEGVNHVASMRLGGDVDGMETQTQDWVEELSLKSGKLKRKMVCHRLVLDTVARDLSTFAWCKVLLSCIADAVEAAQQAYKIGILHRDLSAGNIMIVKDKETKEWRGLLIDWDMCLLWKKHSCWPRSGRTGTWAFISAHILQSPISVPHTLADDMESAFWVFLYEILLYLKHSMDPHALRKRIQIIFSDNTHLQDGSVVGGHEKMNVLTQCTIDNSDWVINLDKPGVNEVLNEMGKVFHRRYRKVNDPRFKLDDLADDPWFCNYLRDAARKMEPLYITPTGLESPTNDSNAPDDPKEWKPASVDDSKIDYYLMPLGGNPQKSTNVQKRQESEITSARIHGLDGSLFSLGKRSHISEAEDEEEPSSKRWHR